MSGIDSEPLNMRRDTFNKLTRWRNRGPRNSQIGGGNWAFRDIVLVISIIGVIVGLILCATKAGGSFTPAIVVWAISMVCYAIYKITGFKPNT